MSDYTQVTMKCDVCGSSDFLYDDELYHSINEAEMLKCTNCNKEFAKQELIDSNIMFIQDAAEQQVHDLLKKEFKNSKYIKFK